jgi:hypothetical protein
MKNTKIPLSKLALETANFANPRREAHGVPELALSIAMRGLMVPLQVRRDTDAFAVVDGGRRFRALCYIRDAKARAAELKALTKDEHTAETEAETEIVNEILKLDLFGKTRDWRVPVLEGDPLVDGDNGQAMVEALINNVARNELSSSELGRALAYLIDERKLLTGKQAAAVLAKSMAWVSRAKNGWQALSDRGKAAWLNGLWTDQDVESIQNLPEPDRAAQEEIVSEAREAAAEAIANGADPREASGKALRRIKRAAAKVKGTDKPKDSENESKGPSKAALGLIVQRLQALGDLPDEAELFVTTLQYVLGDIGEGDLPEEILAILAAADDKAREDEQTAAKAALAKALKESKPKTAKPEPMPKAAKPEPMPEPMPAKAKRRRRNGKRGQSKPASQAA